MHNLTRRSIGLVLGFLAFLGPLTARSQAQYASVGLGLNPYVNPSADGGSGYGSLGYGSLLSGESGESGHDEGINSGLLSGAIYGAGYGYGYGLSNVQWMMNPYQGYLQGAADLTRANAQYWQTIQQARMTRQESIRSSLETRRAMIEAAQWERAHVPDPERIRQRTLERELSAARLSAPPNDIWSGRALNTLLRHLMTQQVDGAKGPRIPLSEDIVNHVNVKVGDSVGHVGLLKKNGELDWPEALQGSTFKEGREQLNALMRRAYKSVASGNNPDAPTLNDLEAQYKKLRKTVDVNVDELKPNEYIEAKRYLDEVDKTIKGLEDPNVGRQFSDDWRPVKVRNVTELVRHMRDKGLLFAPASASDEAAYVALYHALAAFDARMGRVVISARSNSFAGESK